MALLATGTPAAFTAGTALVFALGWSWPGLMTFAVVRLNPAAPAVATSYTPDRRVRRRGHGAGRVRAARVREARTGWRGRQQPARMLAASGLMLLGRRLLVADRARQAALAG